MDAGAFEGGLGFDEAVNGSNGHGTPFGRSRLARQGGPVCLTRECSTFGEGGKWKGVRVSCTEAR
jgi:hypothetical protein